MRRVVLLLSFLPLFLIFGCTGSGESDRYYNIIPEESELVLAINIEALATKMGVGNSFVFDYAELVDLNFLPPYCMELLSLSEGIGLDLEKELFVFFGPLSGVVAKVSDKANLQRALERFIGEIEIVENNGYCKVYDEGELFAVFNDKVFFCHMDYDIEEAEYEKYLEEYFSGTVQRSSEYYTVYQKLLKGKRDVSSLSSLQKSLALSPLPVSLFPVFNSGSYYISGLNFERERIVFSSEYYIPDGTESDELKGIAGKKTNRFMDYFPEDLLSYMGISIRGAEIAKLFEKSAESYSYMGLNKVQIEQYKKVLSAIEGDVSAGLLGMKNSLPSLLLYAELDNRYLLDFMLEWMESQRNMGRVIELNPDNYEFRSEFLNSSLFFGLKDDVFYLCTDKTVRENLLKKEANSFSSSVKARNLKKSDAGWILDVEELMKDPMVMLGLSFSAAGWIDLLSELEYVEVLLTDPSHMEFNVHLKDKKENSLRVLAKYLNDEI